MEENEVQGVEEVVETVEETVAEVEGE